MSKFAFLVHPTSVASVRLILNRFSKILAKVSDLQIKNIMPMVPCFKYLNVGPIRSPLSSTEGVVIICPLLPEHFVSIQTDKVERKIMQGVEVSQRLGVDIVGLGGFTSIFTNQGESIKDKFKVAITTGNTYTASLVIESIKKAVSLLEFDLNLCTMAIIGASGDIGSICASSFNNKVKRLLLVARDRKKLGELRGALGGSMTSVEIVDDLEKAIVESQIILTTTSATTTLVDPLIVLPGSIVCDVSMPPNVAKSIGRIRDDILVYQGGYAEMPSFDLLANRKFKEHFNFNSIYGCLAETMILALERKIVNFSFGRGNINLDKIMDISALAQKHGFKLAPFSCDKKVYSKGDFLKIKNARSLK